MIANIKNYLIGAGVLILMILFSYIGGCQHGKKIKTCPDIVTNIVHVTDTVIHNIVDTFPYYIAGNERIVYHDTGTYHIVDTGLILKDYFATHIFDRVWRDSLIEVTMKDYISQNKPVDNVFKYKILRDQTVTYTNVDNSVNYARYVYFGASLPIFPAKANSISNINYIGLDLIYAAPKMYLRAGYVPYTKTYTVGTGIKIFKFGK